MANFCLLPDKINDFKKALKDKEITIPELLNMTSEARTELLRNYAGDAAPQVNTLFEEKLILKNRMLGIKNWASKMGEIGKYSAEGKVKLQQSLSEYRAAQQERIFSPKENQAFLASLAEKEMGTAISPEEAKQVFELSKQVSDLKENFDGQKWSNEQDRLTYGVAKVQYENYVSELKGEEEPFKEIVRGKIQEFKNEPYKPKAVVKLGLDALKTISNNSISLVATLDNSFLGRQGLKTLLTHPSSWWSGAQNSFIDAFKTLGGKETMDALMADVYSRPRYLNGEYQKAGILTKTEEQFPTSLPERIPALGRVFKASEVAFKGSALRMRIGLYDLLSDMAENQGISMSDAQIKDVGSVINSLTARGKWGKYGESPIVKLVLWAPRMLKGNLDILTAHGAGTGLETNFARKEAFKNLLKIVGSIATVLAIARAIKKDSVEFDTTSSNFGSLVVKDTKMSRAVGALADFVGISSSSSNGQTKFDVTGGLNSLITFFSREIQNKSKSSTTGIVSPFGPGFGQNTRFDAFIQFLTGKTTPIVSQVIQFAREKTIDNKAPNLKDMAYGMFVPISIQNILQINQSGKIEIDWSQNPGAELLQFKEKMGEDKFKQANDEYNQIYTEKLKKLQGLQTYRLWSNQDKQKAITKLKDDVKNQIFKKYGFKYKAPKKKPFKLPSL